MNLNFPLKTLGVLTSGGDAPGMNPCIRAVVRAGQANGYHVLGVVNGFDGLIRGAFRPLGPRDVGGILQRGGTILQTARSDQFLEVRWQREAVRNINDARMDALIIIGGDGSQKGAAALYERGIPTIGIPASIDNDIFGTDMCIGVDTALNTIMDAIDKLRDTASSLNRAFIIETVGQASGYLAVQAGIVTGAEMVLVPEIDTPVERVAQTIEEAYRRGKTHCIVVMAEGAKPGAASLTESLNKMEVGFHTRVTILGHIQRGGKPSAFDRMLASRFGSRAVALLSEGSAGVMTALVGREIQPLPLSEVASGKKQLPLEYYQMANILAQ